MGRGEGARGWDEGKERGDKTRGGTRKMDEGNDKGMG